MSKLRVLLVEEDPARPFDAAADLERGACTIVARQLGAPGLAASAASARPDIVVVISRAADGDLLDALRLLMDARALPVALFVDESSPETTREALRAGVASYVVNGLAAGRLRSAVDVAVARFQEIERLKRELHEARASLADRKVVERAKGILMRSRGLAEEDAYALLRKTAMSRNVKLSELARRVIEMSDFL